MTLKITLEPTTKLVMLSRAAGPSLEARVWQGETAEGVKVHAFVAMVAVDENAPEDVHRRFATELEERAAPTPEVQAIPLRMLL